MTVGWTDAGAADRELLRDIAELLCTAAGEDGEWIRDIRPDARLESDLQLESIELAALGTALRERYGDRVDLPAHVAGLDIDQIIGLTVGDLVDYVRRQLRPAHPGSGQP